MRLYIIRHGQSDWNASGRIQGQLDTQLSEKGFKQIECVAQRLSTVQFDAAYSSPLTRARLTAEAILHGSDVELQLDDRLKELAFGVWEGKSLEEIQETDAENWDWYRLDMSRMRIPGADNYANRMQEARTFYEMLLEKYPGQENVLMVSHGAFIRCFLAEIMGIEPRAARYFAVLNTSVTVMDASHGGHMRILTVGDASHLNERYMDDVTV